MEGPYALRLADSERRLVVEAIGSGDEEPVFSFHSVSTADTGREGLRRGKKDERQGGGGNGRRDSKRRKDASEGRTSGVAMQASERPTDPAVGEPGSHPDAAESLRSLKRATMSRLRHLEELGW